MVFIKRSLNKSYLIHDSQHDGLISKRRILKFQERKKIQAQKAFQTKSSFQNTRDQTPKYVIIAYFFLLKQ